MKLKIVAPSPGGHQAEIYLNGEKMLGVAGIDVRLKVDEVNQAIITLNPSEIDIEGYLEITELARPDVFAGSEDGWAKYKLGHELIVSGQLKTDGGKK